MRNKKLIAALALALGSPAAFAADPTVDQKIEVLQQEIEALKAQIKSGGAQTDSGDTGIAQTDNLPAPAGVAPSDNRRPPIIHKVKASDSGRTTIGGYGEVHYNNYIKDEKDDEVDLHRFVLFFGHKFNDWISLSSELEVEHAFVEGDEGGEVAMEQAYLNFHFSDAVNLRTGLQLIPMGFLNEIHEPPTFFGVERNEIETRIIPSTWRELAVSLTGQPVPGLEYHVGVSNGLAVGDEFDADKPLKKFRQGGSEASANDLAFYGALNYRGLPGLTLGGSVFTGNMGQNGAKNPALEGIDARATLWDLHAQANIRNFHLRALYARGTISDAGALSNVVSSGSVPEAFYGWYVEPAYTVWQSGDKKLIPFARYERFNTQDEMPTGIAADPDSDEQVTTLGMNFYPTANVVFKADYQDFDKVSTNDRWNLGVGYMF
ncbi:hypothetical protein [Thermithiobacillus plumbiphilus]|uniref:Phosphate-selective porin O and P n=1 Tax=Thermithiobacillus plumbiphilus TaxID=1729899 RepID=A0ABU9D7F0_9PROT